MSPSDPEGTELLLEPATHPGVQPYRDALIEDGIPLAQFGVDDVRAQYDRLIARGVTFTQRPADLDGELTAVSTTPAATSS